MDTINIIYSPTICYEISKSSNGYGIDIYLEGHKHSQKPHLHYYLADFSQDRKNAEDFAHYLSANCAMPVHIPELAEEFLSINRYSEN